MKIHDWDPSQGDALQGDVCIFRLPDSIVISTEDEIRPENGRLVVASGEVTGHHHAIFLRNAPVMFREDGSGAGVVSAADTAAMVKKATRKKTGTARLYRDPDAVQALIACGELLRADLAIGFLIVEGGPVVVRHEEHDGIRLDPGRYYCGNQIESVGAEERVVRD